MRRTCLHNRKSTEVVNKARVLLIVPSANAPAYVVHDSLARFEVPTPIVVLPNQHVVLAVANDIDQTGSATSPGNRRCFSIRHPVYPKSATFTNSHKSNTLLDAPATSVVGQSPMINFGSWKMLLPSLNEISTLPSPKPITAARRSPVVSKRTRQRAILRRRSRSHL